MDNGQPDGYDVFLSFARPSDGASPTVALITGTLAQLQSGLDIRSSQPLAQEGAGAGDPAAPEGATVFVAVLSPDYFATDEMEGAKFARAARSRPGAGDPPIFLLVESPVDAAQIPVYLQDARRHEAFGDDGVLTDQHLRTACKNLAYDVMAAIDKAKAAAPASAEPESPDRKPRPVFLAHTHEDLSTERKQLLDELHDRGFLVAPQADRGVTEEQIVEATNKISEAAVSVHLLNSRYDEAAAEEAIAARGKTRRLVWIEPDSDPLNSTMKDLFADVERAEEGTTPYSKHSLEEFRKELLRELDEHAGTPASENTSAPSPSSADLLDVYVYYESSDARQTQLVVDFLDRHDCITWPSMYGPETETAERVNHHEDVMSFCHGILVVAGKAPYPSWLKGIRSENRRGWPGRPVACCYFDPMDDAKQEFKPRDVSRIVAGSGLPLEARSALQGFLETLRQRPASKVE